MVISAGACISALSLNAIDFTGALFLDDVQGHCGGDVFSMGWVEGILLDYPEALDFGDVDNFGLVGPL